MAANLYNIHEKYNIFIQKNRMYAEIFTLFRHFQLSRTFSRLKMEKQQGVSASLLIVLLRLFRMCHESIDYFYSHSFYGLFESDKNCFYRMYNRSSMNWRKLLLRMSVRFMSIVREDNAEEKDHAHCFIIDDTTLEKTGSCMEGISRVFDHVTHGFVLGYKLLRLAYFDGQIADCTLCFITYTLLALDKRFSEYETMGELFGQHRSDLMALTFGKGFSG